MRLLILLMVLSCSISALGQATSDPYAPIARQSSAPTSTQSSNIDKDPRNQPYSLRYLARAMGNIGGWWSFLKENEKEAFLNGYQTAMARSYSYNGIICKIIKDAVKPSSDQEAFMNQLTTSINICESAKEFDGFDKITIKDLNDFYSNPTNQPMTNQPILIEWTMTYLRDKKTNRKTEGQLLDTLNAEQKEVHDCDKYPHLCKLGMNIHPKAAP